MKRIINTKWFYAILLAIFLISFQPQQANACDIEFEIVDNEKDVYEIGDILVVKVKVTLTHRSCPVALKKTKFTMKGLKVLGSTEWAQNSTMVWVRKLKIEVTGSPDGKLVLNVIRECDKDGGFGALKLTSIPLK